jgi:hypothetical protein
VPPYLQLRPLPWLTSFLARGYLSTEEAQRLCSFADLFGSRLGTVETEVVYYPAISGEGDLAIQGFAWLLRSCRYLARRTNDGTLSGWCRARVIADAANKTRNKVMTYLPEILDGEDDLARLSEVVADHSRARTGAVSLDRRRISSEASGWR